MVLSEFKSQGHRYDASSIRDFIEIFLCSRSAYKKLRKYLQLPSNNTLKSYFGKLGSAGSTEECATVVKNVFSHLNGPEKFCYVSADEIYIKAAIRYRAGHILGLGVDQEPAKPAKTILSLMINFLHKIPAFIARLVRVTSLKEELLEEQLIILIQIIHASGGYVFLTMTDNLSVDQKLFKSLHHIYGQDSLSAIYHPVSNIHFPVMYLCYDPVHLLKNFRNNWMTEKTQSLEFKDPESERVVVAKWSDLKSIYKEESGDIVKISKLDYATIYPNNFEKQKVSLVLNVFNEKTIAALRLKGYEDTAFVINIKFVENNQRQRTRRR